MKDSNIALEALKSKQIEMGSQIRRQGQLLLPAPLVAPVVKLFNELKRHYYTFAVGIS